MSSADPDWRRYVDQMVYCYGCGRFSRPAPGQALPRGWKKLYQPHGDGAPVGIQTCSLGCENKVREAMKLGPVYEPLSMSLAMVMPVEMKEAMMAEIRAIVAELTEDEDGDGPGVQAAADEHPRERTGED